MGEDKDNSMGERVEGDIDDGMGNSKGDLAINLLLLNLFIHHAI